MCALFTVDRTLVKSRRRYVTMYESWNEDVRMLHKTEASFEAEEKNLDKLERCVEWNYVDE